MSVPSLGAFPNTIANLPDRPNLSAQRMKEALQDDVKTLWEHTADLTDEYNSSFVSAPLPLAVNKGGTGATTPANARNNLGIYAGKTAPSSMAASLPTGAIYIYAPTLP